MRDYTFVYAPVSGKTRDVTELPDPVFAQKLVGDGVAITPSDNIIKSPCDGKLNHFFETNHAFTLTTGNNCEILVHLGIDTVELNGKGFERIIDDVDRVVKAGEPLVKMDFEYIRNQGKEIDIIVILSDSDNEVKMKKRLKKTVQSGDWIFRFVET